MRANAKAARAESARTEAEAAAMAALPGLRGLDVRGFLFDMMNVCAALLVRLGRGGAVASLRLHVLDPKDTPMADCAALAQLAARSRTLTALIVEGNTAYRVLDVTRVMMEGVRQNLSLATLSVSRNHILRQDAAALAAAVAHCRTLTDLQLYDCAISDDGVEALVTAIIQSGSNIRTLNLSGNWLRRQVGAIVGRLLASDRCAIQSLDLSGCDMCAGSLAWSLRTNRTLTRLQLNRCNWTDDDWADATPEFLAALQGNAHIALHRLDLLGAHFNTWSATALAYYLRTAPTMEQLDLSACRLDNELMAALAPGFGGSRSLRELRLGRNLFGAAGSTALAAGIGACSALTLLDVSHNDAFDDGAMAALAPALVHLRTFDARNCGLAQNSAAPLASLLQPGSHLETLRLSNNAIGSASVTAMAAALHSSSPLRTLCLWNCSFSAAGAVALGEALRRGWSVTDLNLENNGQVSEGRAIGDVGALALAGALEQRGRLCSLRALRLSSCGLSVAGSLALVRAGALVPSLTVLCLRANPTSYSLPLRADQKAALLAARGTASNFELLL